MGIIWNRTTHIAINTPANVIFLLWDFEGVFGLSINWGGALPVGAKQCGLSFGM